MSLSDGNHRHHPEGADDQSPLQHPARASATTSPFSRASARRSPTTASSSPATTWTTPRSDVHQDRPGHHLQRHPSLLEPGLQHRKPQGPAGLALQLAQDFLAKKPALGRDRPAGAPGRAERPERSGLPRSQHPGRRGLGQVQRGPDQDAPDQPLRRGRAGPALDRPGRPARSSRSRSWTSTRPWPWPWRSGPISRSARSA